jgi:hypothetical protein
MDAIFENRFSKRIDHKATVMIETRDTGNFHYATMHNFSGDGIYCGSDYALSPGISINIRYDSPPYASAPKIYLGKVRRCEKLEGDYNTHLYGLGIKIIKALYD